MNNLLTRILFIWLLLPTTILSVAPEKKIKSNRWKKIAVSGAIVVMVSRIGSAIGLKEGARIEGLAAYKEALLKGIKPNDLRIVEIMNEGTKKGAEKGARNGTIAGLVAVVGAVGLLEGARNGVGAGIRAAVEAVVGAGAIESIIKGIRMISGHTR